MRVDFKTDDGMSSIGLHRASLLSKASQRIDTPEPLSRGPQSATNDVLTGCSLKFLDLKHIEPVKHHHPLDQIAFEVQMYAVILVALDTHIVSTQMLDAAPIDLDRALGLENANSLVALAHIPFVRLFETGGVGRQEETRPEAAPAFTFMRDGLGG